MSDEEAPPTQDNKEAVETSQDVQKTEENKKLEEDNKKLEEDNKNTCCCIFVNFPLLGVWGLFWTFIWPIFALVVMILFAVSLSSSENCFKPAFVETGLGSIFQLLLALLCIAIIVTAILYFYDMYLFGAFSNELPELYVKARAGTLTDLLPDAPSRPHLKDIELEKMGYQQTPDGETLEDNEKRSDDPKDREKAKNPDLPTSPTGFLGKMIAYCEWKFYRLKRIPSISFYHVQGGFDLVIGDILSLCVVVSFTVGVGFINVSGLLVLIKSVTSVVRHLIGDLFCTNGNILKKTVGCCGVPRKCIDCLKKSCDCLKNCKCDCLKKCKCDCLKKCKMDCCKKDIDCRHFKLRCRNISFQNAKKKASDAKKQVTTNNLRNCLISSPLCTAISLGLLVSTAVLAACCAVHTVGEEAWTLGGGVANLELHPSFPMVSGLSHFRLSLNSSDGTPDSSTCENNQLVSLVPFQGSSSYESYCTTAASYLRVNTRLFRTGAKVYLEVETSAPGCEAVLFTKEIDLLSCLGSFPCVIPIANSNVNICSRFQGALFHEFSLASLRVCSL